MKCGPFICRCDESAELPIRKKFQLFLRQRQAFVHARNANARAIAQRDWYRTRVRASRMVRVARVVSRDARATTRATRVRDARCVSTLDDGVYDCVVTDVMRDDDDVVVIELAIASGVAKGNTIRLRSAMQNEPLDWLGLPGTLRVVDKFSLGSFVGDSHYRWAQ
jgi:hypothetical protein